MEEHSQIITVYLPANFEKEFEDFKEYIMHDERFDKLTKKEQYVSLALRFLIKTYNNTRNNYYSELAKKREQKESESISKTVK